MVENTVKINLHERNASMALRCRAVTLISIVTCSASIVAWTISGILLLVPVHEDVTKVLQFLYGLAPYTLRISLILAIIFGFLASEHGRLSEGRKTKIQIMAEKSFSTLEFISAIGMFMFVFFLIWLIDTFGGDRQIFSRPRNQGRTVVDIVRNETVIGGLLWTLAVGFAILALVYWYLIIPASILCLISNRYFGNAHQMIRNINWYTSWMSGQQSPEWSSRAKFLGIELETVS